MRRFRVVLLEIRRSNHGAAPGVMAHLVQRRPPDPMDSMIRGSNPVRSTRKLESLSESKYRSDSLLVCPTPRVKTHAYECTHVKDPVVHVKVQWIRETRKHCTQEKNTPKLGSAVLWLLAFPGESSQNFPCIALGQENYRTI